MSGSTYQWGKIAYDAYGAAVDWTAYNGERIKPWEEQDPIRQHAWSRGAEAVADSVKATAAAAMIGLIPEQHRASAMREVSRSVGLECPEKNEQPSALDLVACRCGGSTCG